MIAALLTFALLSAYGLPGHEADLPAGPPHDRTEAGIRAWKARNQEVWEARQQSRDEDTLELVGRWPFGGAFQVRPSWDFPNDSIVYMASGSGIRILDASNPARPQMLGQVNCYGTLSGTAFLTRDTLLYVLYSYTRGLQIFSVADPTAPYELGRLDLDGDVAGLALKDSYAFVTGWDSLFRVVNVANPRQPRQETSVLLPFDGLSVDVKGDYAYVGGSFAGLVAVDVSNPLSPQIRGQAGGFDGMSVVCDTSRPYIYVASWQDGLQVVSIANPAQPSRVATLATGDARDVFKCDTFVYLVGVVAPYQSDMFVVSVANPLQPRLIGQSRGDGWTYGVCAASPFSCAYTCDGWEGIHVRSLADPANPVVDTAMWGASASYDLAVQDSLVFYANMAAGLKVLSVRNPERPVEIGSCDTANRRPDIQTVAVQDSFAYTMWQTSSGQTLFRSIDVSDPTAPRPSGGEPTLWTAKAIVLRDTLAFVAEDYKFEVYNIARPRQPVRIGRCDLADVARGMDVQGDYAYVAKPLAVVDIRDPTAPAVVGSASSNSLGLDVVDTFAFVASADGLLEVFSVADPTAPYRVTAAPVTGICYDVEVRGGLAYVGCYRMEVYDVTDPTSPVRAAGYDTPYYVRRLRYDSSHVYAACADGGLCIFRACTTGIGDAPGVPGLRTGIRLAPNPSRGVVRMTVSEWPEYCVVLVRNAAGQRVGELAVGPGSPTSYRLDLAHLPDGCYFVEVPGQRGLPPAKLVIARGR